MRRFSDNSTFLATSGGILFFLGVFSAPAFADTYPNVYPSAWYLQPTQQLSFSGKGFLPNESVTIRDSSGIIQTKPAESNGTFSANNALTIPYSWQNTRHTFAILRSAPGGQSTPNPITIHIGGLRPEITPSSWYVVPKTYLALSGTGFSPNETVIIGGAVSNSVRADTHGNFATGRLILVPFDWKNSSRTITARGDTSGVSAPPVTVAIGWFYPQITPSSWWIAHNQSMSVSATGFPWGEKVSLLINGTEVSQTTTDGAGNASFTFTTPSSGDTAKISVINAQSGLSASHTIGLH